VTSPQPRSEDDPGGEAPEADQARSRNDQTHADSDQAGSAADQAGSDSDQAGADADQAASNADQETADRDYAHADRHAARTRAYETSRAERTGAAAERADVSAGREASTASRESTAVARSEEALYRDAAAFEVEVRRRTAVVVEHERALLADAEELACAGSWEYDPRAGSITWSPGMYRIRGRTPSSQSLTLETATLDVHPDDRVRVATEYAHADPADDHRQSTHRITRPDGSVRHLETRSRVERDLDGLAVRIMGVSVDVTDRVQAQSALEMAQAVAGLGSWEWDIAAGSIAWSATLCRIYGVAPNQRRSFEEFLALVHPGDRARVRSTVEVAYETHQPYEFEHRIVRSDGVVRVLNARGEVSTDDAGRPVRMLGTGQDITERRAAEESRARLAALVDFSDDAIIGATLDGLIESWNRGAQALYGYTAGEAVGRSVSMLAPPECRDEVRQLIAALHQGENVAPLETMRITKSGRRIDVSLRVSLVHDTNGAVVGVSSITRGITGQKLLEARLRSSSRYFELSRDLAVTTDVDGYLRSANPALEQILGWSPDEFLSRPFIDLVHPDDRADTEREFGRIGEGKIAFSFLNRFQAKDGDYRWLDWNAILAPEEALLYCAARDVTDRKRVDAALAASERQMRQILETAHDAFVAIDGGGVITDWNPQAETMFGWSAAEAVGRLLAEVIVPESQRAAHRRGLARFAPGRESQIVGRLVELSAVHRDGREFPIELTISTVVTERGHAFTAFLRDITERRRAEEELRQARDRALEASRMKSIFVANVSHEIRTPMNGVIGMSELLLDTDLEDDQREFAEMISSSGEALLEVIDDILDFSKIEAGKLELDPTDFNLCDAVEQACGLQARRAQQGGLELVVAIDPDLPTRLRGDVARLRQVISNFVSNAIKFTAKGEVVIRATPAAARPGADFVRVEVSDTGIGIERAALDQLFKPFSQADGSTTRKYGGTGLGLAISRQLIELMGGTVGAESRPGEGSSFWFEIPLDRPAVPERPHAQTREPVLARLRVLVVDDNATSRRTLEQQLGSRGMTCTVAENAAAAMELLDSAVAAGLPYELALIDRNMPGVDGYGLARAIRAQSTLSDTRLVLLSSAGGRPEAVDSLFDWVPTKPVRQSRLHEELQSLIVGEDPAAQRLQKPSTPDAGVDRVDVRLLEVLVVEDTPVNQAVAVRMLERCGFHARVAANGREAFEALTERSYAAVLMDCQMPELDGYQTTREIRRGERDGRRIPVIAMTASSMQGERERCLAAGMDDYLTKPMRNQTLKDMLNRWVADPAVPVTGFPQVVVAADAASGPAILDRSVLAELDLDPEALSGLVSVYFNQVDTTLAELHGAIHRAEPRAVARAAHKLRGSSGAIGAKRVADLATELEATARGTHLIGASALLDRLSFAVAETRKALARPSGSRGD